MDLNNLFSIDKTLFESHLNEDLGNLNYIDPEFRKIFKGRKYLNSKNKITNANLGQMSPIDTVEISSAKDAVTAFLAPSSNVMGKPSVEGMVLRIEGRQVLGLGKMTDKTYSGKTEYKAAIDVSFYSEIEKDKERLSKVAKIILGYATSDLTRYDGIKEADVSEAECRTLINSFYKAAIADGIKEIDAYVIKADINRIKTHNDRVKAKIGSIPSKGEVIRSNEFKREASRSLMARLDKFKTKNAKQYATPEEFMAAAIKNGFMDKINIDGFAYNLKEDMLRLSDISKPSSWYKSNAIVYEIDIRHSEKLKELQRQMYDLYKEKDQNPAVEAKINEFKEKFPPSEIRVIMGLSGGTIVPQSIEVVKGRDYF